MPHSKLSKRSRYAHQPDFRALLLPHSKCCGEKGMAARHAASRHLRQLAQIGVLKEVAVGREKLFIYPKLLRTQDTTNIKSSPILLHQ